LGVQYWLKYFSSHFSNAKKKYNSQLCSSAAKQMLVYHSEYQSESNPTNNPVRTEFIQNLDGLGFPTKLRKIAIANGAGNAYGQRNNKGNTLDPGDKILSLNFINTFVDFVGNSWAVPNISSKTKIFEGVIMTWLILGFPIPVSEVWNIYASNTFPYDNAPGGTFNTTGQIAEELSGIITTNASNHCFIPTVSSLAIETTDLFHNISTDPNILSKTPFDAIYYPTETNESHINISEDCVSWVLNELIPYNLKLGNEYPNWNSGEVKAQNKIILKPGFCTIPGKSFRTKITPIQTYNP
jgi:hypothetical protein